MRGRSRQEGRYVEGVVLVNKPRASRDPLDIRVCSINIILHYGNKQINTLHPSHHLQYIKVAARYSYIHIYIYIFIFISVVVIKNTSFGSIKNDKRKVRSLVH